MTEHDRETRTVTGQVVQWHEDEGWGVVESAELDGPVWAHFSGIDPAGPGVRPGGYRKLTVGDRVRITAERAWQDGFHWRATWITWE